MWQVTCEQTGCVNQQVSTVQAFAIGAASSAPPTSAPARTSRLIPGNVRGYAPASTRARNASTRSVISAAAALSNHGNDGSANRCLSPL